MTRERLGTSLYQLKDAFSLINSNIYDNIWTIPFDTMMITTETNSYFA